MKTSHLFKTALLGMMATFIFSQAWAQEPPRMKMTTEVPPGIATPDRLETRLGTLTSFDGVPDAETTQLVYDNLDFQRAVQAYLTSLPIASMYAMSREWMSLKVFSS